MKPRTSDTGPQKKLIDEARSVFEADERVLACWLEGSFAAHTADPWSDVDLHIAVDDEHWDGVLAERLALIGRIRPVLGFVETTMPWGTRLVAANVAGPCRLDLFLEKRSALEAAARRVEPLVLFDKADLADKLRVNWNEKAVLQMQLTRLVLEFFFGSAFPVRLSGREEWGTLLMNAVSVVYQFLVPAMLVQEDAADYVRPHYHNERHLPVERRRQIDALVEQIRASFAGLATGELDEALLARAHQDLAGAIWSELRRACKMHGVAYPEDAEREMRDYYQQEMGWEIA